MLSAKNKAFSFSTFRDNKIRTVGTCYLLPHRWGKLSQWDEVDAQALARMFDYQHDHKEATARGKVVYIGDGDLVGLDFSCSCYQVKDRLAAAVFCGNSTAAASTVWAVVSGKDSFSFSFKCLDRELTITAEVKSNDRLFETAQIWQFGENPKVTETTVAGQRAVRCSFLNNYLIIEGPLTMGVDELYNSNQFEIGLQDKIAVVDGSLMPPHINFYNCNGLHGAAPQTGMATISLISRQVDWLSRYVAAGSMATPSGVEALPMVISDVSNRPAISIPKTQVLIEQIGVVG